MTKPELPIDKLSEKEFYELKRTSLEDAVLSEDTLKKVGQLFGVGDAKTATVNCDDYHAHTYQCVDFKHPATGIVDRLIQEVKMYRSQLEKVVEMAKFD